MKPNIESGVIALSVSMPDATQRLTPETTPAAAVGKLFAQMVELLKSKDIAPQEILFAGVTEGCTQLAVRVPAGKETAIAAALMSKSETDLAGIKKTLSHYGLCAKIHTADGFVRSLIPETKPETYEYEVFQEETFRGKVINIGGKDETVPMKLLTENGEVSLTIDSTDLARRIGAHLFDYIECTGSGLLKLDAHSLKWQPVGGRFKIHSFEVLPEADYDAFLAKFRLIDSEWGRTADPIQKIEAIRSGSL
ncbi:Uncharacterised protein [Kingella potus]|uniref:Uncharacterized protein n=1 Tax=Kingella potus TaxID=265175 RepID=A0A377R408_9NEIS|nr:hypothetical protein [Kingella potus]UOP00560.1 hypothetical protein LVJ84_12080 [Kingella potus]UOP01986.1 hypothetical protein LVJ84_14525 [Kingella potus]STQ99818.1 Uncharacterised protein [Kingella potus]STR03046.1 Uncharacterised protein [Kingella potus]STR03063.1 Uncharacterised protein [Kingella potus]